MISQLFGSFKKQVKFINAIQQLKDTCINVPAPVTPSESSSAQSPQVSTGPCFPSVFVLPKFPKNIQTRLDNKEPCKTGLFRSKIVGVLQESMAQYTMYPSNDEYVRVSKALVTKYPFLKDLEGNGYHTWHMSLKRKFKTERAPLVQSEQVMNFKAKFGHRKARSTEEAPQSSCTKRNKPDYECELPVGEDSVSIDAHVKELHMQYERAQPDRAIVEDKMRRTFQWRRRELQQAVSAVEAINKYPFLKTPSGLFQEMGLICKMPDVNQRFRESFRSLVPALLQAIHGKTSLEKLYLEARAELSSEEVNDVDFRAALVLLPILFKEKLDNYISLTDGEPATPYPTVQVAGSYTWTQVFTEKRVPVTIKVDGSTFCSAVGVEDGVLSAFCMYFVFSLQYPSHNRNTLIFLQRHILKVTDPADKALPTAVLRAINLLA
ncbi:uncharacterized protein LOC132899915 [Neoarius graeffei]|nr:uncharacterized protein LOC132899915 [Neoarius graeffei]